MIDLHTHSVFSDGTLTPEELVDQARRLDLKGLALTDHDTVAGIPRFLAAAAAAGIWAAAGVEISVEYNPGGMHVLGYFIDPDHPLLNKSLVQIREGRTMRNREILARLQRLGCEIEWEEVCSMAGEDVVGRPHFAQVLIAHGYVKNKQEAFDRYLGKNRPAYANRFRLSPENSLQLIRRSGGIPVLAHPATLDLETKPLRSLVASLRDHGLEGIEVYYSEHSPRQRDAYLRLAKQFDLVATGGSDFHGEDNPAIALGRGFGSLHVPDSVITALENRRPRPGSA